jgi:translocator protein
MVQYASLAVFVVLVFVAASSGAIFKPGAWYASLAKPTWTPPNWAFPVVWTVLYTMIAVAGWFVWKVSGFSAALVVWGIGLVVNALWSYFMFGRQDIAVAMADVALLWLLTAAFIYLAWDIDRRAAYLFMPYLLWVSIAAALNFEVWRLNPA